MVKETAVPISEQKKTLRATLNRLCSNFTDDMLNSKTTQNKEVLGRMGITEENEKVDSLKN